MPWTAWWKRRRQARRNVRALLVADDVLVAADDRSQRGFVPSGGLAMVWRQRNARRAEVAVCGGALR